MIIGQESDDDDEYKDKLQWAVIYIFHLIFICMHGPYTPFRYIVGGCELCVHLKYIHWLKYRKLRTLLICVL